MTFNGIQLGMCAAVYEGKLHDENVSRSFRAQETRHHMIIRRILMSGVTGRVDHGTGQRAVPVGYRCPDRGVTAQA